MDTNEWYTKPHTSESPTPPPAANGYSIASMVLGICAVVFSCCCTYLAVVLGALAIGFALLHRSGGRGFNGMSMTGFICGIVGLVFAILGIVLSKVFEEAIHAYLDEYLKLLEEGSAVAYLKTRFSLK